MSRAVFALPDLGEGLNEADIVAWRVSVGDQVDVDEEIVTVETAKAAVDVPCPYAGTVVQVHAEPGQSVPVGAALVTVEVMATQRSADAPAREDSGAVLVGYGTAPPPTRHAGPRRRRGPRAVSSDSGPPNDDAVKVLSPLVRREAAARDLDLRRVRPQHRDGVIRRADLLAADPAPAARPTDGEPLAGASTRLPITGVRGAIARQVTTAHEEIPAASAWVDVDATPLLELKTALADHRPDTPVSLVALLTRILVAGLREFPELNARVDTSAGEIVQYRAVHLGIAVQSPRGLVVPVLRDADAMTSTELSAALRELTSSARAGTLAPAQMRGGTFTMNNYGPLGVDGSTPILHHPQAGMLGVGRIVERPWAHTGTVALRQVAQLSITFDHRVCDGGTAGGLLRFVADAVERPSLVLAHV